MVGSSTKAKQKEVVCGVVVVSRKRVGDGGDDAENGLEGHVAVCG